VTQEAAVLTTAEETVIVIPGLRKKATTRVLVRAVGQTSLQARSAQGLKSIRTRNSSRSNSDRDSAKNPTPKGWGLLFDLDTGQNAEEIDVTS
jgi:hypothetical protein